MAFEDGMGCGRDGVWMGSEAELAGVMSVSSKVCCYELHRVVGTTLNSFFKQSSSISLKYLKFWTQQLPRLHQKVAPISSPTLACLND